MFLLLGGVHHDLTCLFVYISDVLNKIRHDVPVFIIASGEFSTSHSVWGGQSKQLESQIDRGFKVGLCGYDFLLVINCTRDRLSRVHKHCTDDRPRQTDLRRHIPERSHVWVKRS